MEDDNSLHWPPDAPEEGDSSLAASELGKMVISHLRQEAEGDATHLLCDLLEHPEYAVSYGYLLLGKNARSPDNFQIGIMAFARSDDGTNDPPPLAIQIPPLASAMIINRLHADDRLTIANTVISDYIAEYENTLEECLHGTCPFKTEEDLFEEEPDANESWEEDEEDGDTLEESDDDSLAYLEMEDRSLYEALRDVHRRIFQGMLEEK